MTQITAFPGSGNYDVNHTAAPQRDHPGIARRRWMPRIMLGLFTVATAFCVPLSIAATTPAAGDAYVYRLVNGYNRETVGHVRHEFTPATTAQGLVVSVTVDIPSLGVPHTEIFTPDGLWLRHPLDNHGIAVDYEFTPALPVYLSPLTPGKSWSVRVNAKAAGEYANRSVRIDGEVLGNERIRVPAGEFDTVKIRRIIYPGDAGDFKTETRIVEFDWYAPALGRTVRSETRSDWRQLQGCRRGYCDYHGDWNVLELTEADSGFRN